jgi:hypothetical protein
MRERTPAFSLRAGGVMAAPSNAGISDGADSAPVVLRRRSISARCNAS